MEGKLQAFVIMPFDPEFNLIYDQLIRPPFENAGYDVTRADSMSDQRSILQDIVCGIASADIVIADLTAVNPNVMYELGLSHALGRPTIILTQSLDDIPFDLRAYRANSYSVRFDQADKLKKDLAEIAEKHSKKELNFGNPVSDYLPESRLHLVSRVEKEELKEGDGESLMDGQDEDEEEAQDGFLDYLSQLEESTTEIVSILEQLPAPTEEIGDQFERHSSAIQKVNENPSPGAVSKAHKIALSMSREMDGYSDVVQRLGTKLESQVSDMAEALTGYTSFLVDALDQENVEHVRNTRDQLQELATAVVGPISKMEYFKDSTSSIRSVSRDLRRSVDRMNSSLDLIIDGMEKIEATCSRAVAVINDRLKGFEGNEADT